MTYHDDAYYIQAIKDGQQAAFAALVDKHKAMVFSICNKVIRKSEMAEEVAQDVFVKVYQQIANFRQDAKFTTWLYRIAYNAAISVVRKKNVELAAIDDFVVENFSVDEVQEQVQQMEKEQQLQHMQQAMEQLKEQEALMIQMFYLKEMSVKELAAMMDMTEGNVKVKLHRARKRLYDLMNVKK